MNSNILITSLAIQCRLCVNAVHVIVAVGIRSRDRRSSLVLSSFMSDGYEFQFYFNLHGWYGTVSSSCGGASSSMREKEGRCHLRLVSSLVLSPSSVVFCLQQRKSSCWRLCVIVVAAVPFQYSSSFRYKTTNTTMMPRMMNCANT